MNQADENFEKLNNKKAPKLGKKQSKKLSLTTKFLITFGAILAGTFLFVLIQFTGHTYSAKITYETPTTTTTPGEDVAYQTYESGSYTIGHSPDEYASGDEIEFTTKETGTYVAGEDFPAGIYDIMTVSGHGQVSTTRGSTDINENMEADQFDESYVNIYDNHIFLEGEELVVDGVAITLSPQLTDTMIIEPGEYEIDALKGAGTISLNGATDVNLTMDATDSQTKTSTKYQLTKGDVLNVSGVAIELSGKLPDGGPQPTQTVTEKVEFNTGLDALSCIQNGQYADCNDLKYYDELWADIEKQMEESFLRFIYT